MCGIAGILKFEPGERAEESRLRRMLQTLRHRGPDGEGTFFDGPIGLGHRRLAIVDPEGGRQPMDDETGNAVIVCNGEIYNHPELSKDLLAAGHRYRTHSDTETILHLY
jgi:asparagine synthase (glutamine-hydrolysing)